ncbi:hypothetical protein [Chitinophaga ginsengisegetis]|uniref:hypothetical protein n=1 Tax=Chitinophaga ginsengisegetis TaxID=393003 RepID=UPI000DB97674|nr:hypothetical protein [Chitinophaga ginsengisegetis]MDR6569979.1 hypothetical protein [Chitinophaga ginsengisegetis]MDR6649712.1 hypothetical protein [Chitinophaga ginsengisegetis]MDR6656085.1 hypothetical protein [Chitinophaga ginsengisegetis]
MKILLIALTLTGFCSCYNSTESYDESRELVPNPEGYQKDTVIQSPVDSVQLMDTVGTKTQAVQ